MNLNKAWFLTVGLLATGVAVTACGDDDDPTTTSDSGGAAMDSGSGTGGTPGTGGTATGGTGGADSAAMSPAYAEVVACLGYAEDPQAETVQCGDNTCTGGVVFGALKLDACCSDTDPNVCGQDTEAVATVANLRETGAPPVEVGCFNATEIEEALVANVDVATFPCVGE